MLKVSAAHHAPTNQAGVGGAEGTREEKTETRGTDGGAANKASSVCSGTGDKGSEASTGGDDDDDYKLQVAAPAAVVPTTPSPTADTGVVSGTPAKSYTTLDAGDARGALDLGAPRDDMLDSCEDVVERAPSLTKMSDASMKIDSDDSIDTSRNTLPDIEELFPGQTCFDSLSNIQAGRNKLCELEECDQAWQKSGTVCPTKRLPEQSEHPSRFEVERRECPTQLGTLNHTYTQTMQCPPRLPTDEEEMRARYMALSSYDRQFGGCEMRQSQLESQPRSDIL